MRPDLWLLEDLTGCDEAEELVEPDGVQPRVAPDCPAAASSNEVEESGHERAADTLALSGWIGRHPPQSPASRPARIRWLGDERHHPNDHARGLEGREVRAGRIALEADIGEALMRPKHPLAKWQNEKDGYLFDIDVHGGGLYRPGRCAPRERGHEWSRP